MYYELAESELKRIEEISNITCIDYELKGNFIPVESLLEAAVDMLMEYDVLAEKLQDLREEISENYELKKVNPYIEYGVSERDFY
jgi:hypothetical protein